METGRKEWGSDEDHAPFLLEKRKIFSEKFLTIILIICDKKFERLHSSKERERKQKTQRKKITIAVVVCILSIAAAGCGDSAVTDEQIVVPAESAGAHASAAPTGTDIAAQVQAPETWKTEIDDEQSGISVSVDAKITVPDAEGFRLKKVTARAFEQTDYEAVNRALFGEAALMGKEADENGQEALTKDEIEERIEILEEEKAAGAQNSELFGGPVDYDEAIAEFRRMAESAPDVSNMIEIDTAAFFSAGSENGNQSFLSGIVSAGDRDYYISLNNDMREDWKWVTFNAKAKETWYPAAEYGKDVSYSLNTPQEEISESATKAVEAIGLTDYVSAGDEIYCTMGNDGAELEKLAYGVHFIRVVDGIPITYTTMEGVGVDLEDYPVWPYENLYLVYDDNGLAEFKWTNPCIIEDSSEEYVFLMPFEEIQDIFQEMILKKYSQYTQNGADLTFEMKEVKLGYMRIMDKNNSGSGTLVPVWDFFGSQTMRQKDGGTQRLNGAYESWLTINAMDGTVINRDFGY